MSHTPSIRSAPCINESLPLVSPISSSPSTRPLIHRKPVPYGALLSISSDALPEPFDKELPRVPSDLARLSIISQSMQEFSTVRPLVWEDSESWQSETSSSSSLRFSNSSTSTVNQENLHTESASSQDADSTFSFPASEEMAPVFKELHVHNLDHDWFAELERSRPSWSDTTEKSSKKSKKRKSSFHESKMPSLVDIYHASKLPVISSTGIRVSFGDLFLDQKTIVCFIRHFFCPLCQDYMYSISQGVDKKILDEKEVKLVIISNGSWEMIQGYERIFNMPFDVYTDPTLDLYKAMGMTMQTGSKGKKSRRGSYVKHNDLSGTWMVIKNAVKNDMPLLKDAGKITQLGGEFVLGPGLQCSFVHRMRYTADHFSIYEVLAAAGISYERPISTVSTSTVEPSPGGMVSYLSETPTAPCDTISCSYKSSPSPCRSISCPSERSSAPCRTSSCFSDTSTIIGDDDFDEDFSFPLPPDRTFWIGIEDIGPLKMKHEFLKTLSKRYSTHCSSTYCAIPKGLSDDDEEDSDSENGLAYLDEDVERFSREVEMLSVS